jgi:hypothetical protein
MWQYRSPFICDVRVLTTILLMEHERSADIAEGGAWPVTEGQG